MKISLYSLFEQPGFCLIFILRQKRKFLVGSFSENASFISFHIGFFSRYSEIDFKLRQNTLKMQVSKTTSSIIRLFPSLDIYYINRITVFKCRKTSKVTILKLRNKMEHKERNFKERLLTRSFLGFIPIHFINSHQVFLNFQ